MVSRSEAETIFKAASEVLQAKLPDAWAIYVFGSFARGEDWPSSDLDIAVLLPPGVQIEDRLRLISDLSRSAHREVDLIDLRQAGDVLRREVLESGRILFQSDPDKVLAWEGSALTRYGHYREEVRGILEDFQRSGIGYQL